MIRNEQAFDGQHMELDHIPWPAIVIATTTGKIERVNKHASSLYGYDVSEFTNLLWRDLFGDDDTTMAGAEDNHVPAANAEYVHTNKHGQQVKLNTTSRLITHNGEAYCFTIILDAQPVTALNDSDDTQQCSNCAHVSNCSQTLLDMNKVEEAAVCMHYKEIRVGKEKETLLLERVRETEDIIESVAEAFFAADRNWILTYVNRAAEQLYNIKREDVLHRCVWEVFPKVPGSVFHEQYLRAVRENIPVSIEGMSPTSNRWVRSYAYPTKNGIAVFFKDITEQKQLSEQLNHHLDNLNCLINNTEDSIWSVDTECRITTINTACRKTIKDLSNAELKVGDKSLPDELGEELVNMGMNYYRRALNGEAFKIVHELKHGVLDRCYEVSYNPIKNTAGECKGVSCFARDVTASKRLLRQTINQNKTLQEIAWMQSHQIRGPLSTILGLLQLYEHGNTADDSLWFIIQGINEKACQLDNVVRTITDMTYGAEYNGDTK